ncbi:MAG TPA: NPCBM/NEW2 domain-containing protein [Actinocatenispora sp.]
MRRLLALAAAVVLVASGAAAAATAHPTEARALPNGLALTPPMGFNDWNSFGCDVDEQLIEQTADFFVSSGLKAAGYQYVNIDDCWSEKQRSADGHLVPDPVKFPDGIKGTADYVHAKGLKLGIYSSAGDKTCAGYPASFGHETVDAQDFAAWGVDYLKYDNCGTRDTPETKDGYVDRYSRMRDALAATGRPIVYSLCEWGNFDPASWAGDVGNLWRTTGDISDNWASLKNIVRQNMGLYAAAKPGAWNDPDMLEVGNGGMTDTEYRTHFGLWSMMAAPLLIGTDLRQATPATLAVLSNREVIALDQDSLGTQARPVSDSGGHVVFAKPLANGDVAVALYNESDTAATISTTAAAAGVPKAAAYTLRDVWQHATTESAGTIAASVPAHGTAIYRVAASGNWSAYPPAVTAGATAPPAYPGAPVSVVAPGTANPVSTTVTDGGRVALYGVSASLTAPAGWTVRATSPRTAPALPSGRSLSTQWTVTPPAGTPPGTYPLAVTSAYAWDGHHASVSGATSVLVAVPPAAGTYDVSDLDWLSADNDWGPVERDTSNGETAAGDGHTITINGATYAKGLGTNAPSQITYYVGKRCSSLTTDVGIDDEKDGSVALASFQIYADGVAVADSGQMTAADAARHLTADLTGASIVQLVANDEGSANSDHTDWAGPVLTCS